MESFFHVHLSGQSLRCGLSFLGEFTDAEIVEIVISIV